jgi:hypothetical protein
VAVLFRRLPGSGISNFPFVFPFFQFHFGFASARFAQGALLRDSAARFAGV